LVSLKQFLKYQGHHDHAIAAEHAPSRDNRRPGAPERHRHGGFQLVLGAGGPDDRGPRAPRARRGGAPGRDRAGGGPGAGRLPGGGGAPADRLELPRPAREPRSGKARHRERHRGLPRAADRRGASRPRRQRHVVDVCPPARQGPGSGAQARRAAGLRRPAVPRRQRPDRLHHDEGRRFRQVGHGRRLGGDGARAPRRAPEVRRPGRGPLRGFRRLPGGRGPGRVHRPRHDQRANVAMGTAQAAERIGFIVMRVTPTLFDQTLSKRTGLGDTGQILAVGADGLLRRQPAVEPRRARPARASPGSAWPPTGSRPAVPSTSRRRTAPTWRPPPR
jgi:hypothetical protein